MKRIVLSSLIALCLPLAVGAETKQFHANLTGTSEVPAVSTAAGGTFLARISEDGGAIHYQLSYDALEGDVTQAHIHIGQRDVNGGVALFLCSNLGTAGVQACPPPPATISGMLTAADVIGPTAQGVAAGEFAEVVAAIRAGVAYANVHSSKFPGGEIRAQVDSGAP
jgi:hypothetical protein